MSVWKNIGLSLGVLVEVLVVLGVAVVHYAGRGFRALGDWMYR